ncbi:hypothetical protein ACFX13_016697 [Malus domestica]
MPFIDPQRSPFPRKECLVSEAKSLLFNTFPDKLLMVGLWCTHPNNKERPKAEQVMKVLPLEAPLPELPHDRRWYDDPLPQGNNSSPSGGLLLPEISERLA